MRSTLATGTVNRRGGDAAVRATPSGRPLGLPGQLEPGDVRRRVGRRRIAAPALEHVGAVEPGGAHPDEHLARARLGVGVV